MDFIIPQLVAAQRVPICFSCCSRKLREGLFSAESPWTKSSSRKEQLVHTDLHSSDIRGIYAELCGIFAEIPQDGGLEKSAVRVRCNKLS